MNSCERPKNSCEKTLPHLVISDMMWFEKVRGASMHLNHAELVHKHPAHPCTPCFPCKDVVREGSVYTVEPPQTHVNELYTRTHVKELYIPWYLCDEVVREGSTVHSRCVEFIHISLGWFDFTEPSRTTSTQT